MTAPPRNKDLTRSDLEQQLIDARHDLDSARDALHQEEERYRSGKGFIYLKKQYPTEYETESSIISKPLKDFDVIHDPLWHKKLRFRYKFDHMRGIERAIEFRSTYVKKAQNRVNERAHCLEVARIDLYDVKVKRQRFLEQATRVLHNYETALAAGDETYQARIDHQEAVIKHHILVYARRIACREVAVKRNEDMMEIDKEHLRYWGYSTRRELAIRL
ncbi:hypothetical protein G7Y79_00026g059430 [Physcia stellaris]|nr:hypothetical protein G7Y79_00026g059430 [Physcia stellaris]